MCLDIVQVVFCEENRLPQMMPHRDIFISVQNLMTTDIHLDIV